MSTLPRALCRRARALVLLLLIAPLVVPAAAPQLPLALRLIADGAFAPRTARAQVQSGPVFTVNTTRDDFDEDGCEDFGGPGAPPTDADCTLREAITAANEDGVPSTITFNLRADDEGFVDPDPLVGGNEFWRIQINGLFGSLPTIDDNGTVIDGTTQTNSNSSGPDIEINGALVPAAEAIGFDITSSGNTIKGLIINGFAGDNQVFLGFGIRITGTSATSNTVVGNYIGVNYNSTQPISNTFAGIQLSGSASGNTIGGASSADLNIISGNGANGILLDDADNNRIVGNRIGIDNAGQRRQNFGNGIALINGAANNQVGGIGNLRNTISGNTANGIVINNVATTGNRIQGNFIGTNLNGTGAIGNNGAGVQIGLGARNNIIGGAETPQGTLGNVISGNGGAGIRLSGGLGSTNTVFGNRVIGNLIGLDSAGSARIANNGSGVEVINNSPATQIGSALAAERNFIAGNLRYGVEISSSLPSALTGTVLLNNDIGLNAARSQAISNTLGGVLVGPSVNSIQIGNGAISGTNTIAGNGGPGVVTVGTVQNLSVLSNTIGLPALGNATSGIVANGVIISATVSDNNILANGGAGLLLGNVLSGTLTRNRVGTLFNPDPSVNSFVDIGNGGPGIQATGPVTSLQVLSNTVGFNTGGITLTGAVTPTLQANVVFSHTLSGIELSASRATTLISNEVSFNNGGVILTGAVSPTLRANRVLSNTLVGVQIGGSRLAQVLSNTLSFNVAPGLLIDAGTIGSRVFSNTIEGNAGGGARVDGANTVTNTIQGNSFRFNVDPFLDSSVRGVGGVSLSNGANQNIQPPTISYVDRFNNVVGSVNGPGGCGGITCTVELYDAFFGPAR
jgi:CSLREA domain-containing protein